MATPDKARVFFRQGYLLHTIRLLLGTEVDHATDKTIRVLHKVICSRG